MTISEFAPAKVNLTLRVLGRRDDGYHELESLVTFAGVGDRVSLQPGGLAAVATDGPFAQEIEGENLLSRALTLLREADPGLRLGRVALTKIIPVAAGLGGGSADAAALLRAVRRANPDRAGAVDWTGVAARLGADVPVCLRGEPVIMRGRGERLHAIVGGRGEPNIACVLANPRLPLSTAEVFQALQAPALSTVRAAAQSRLPEARPFAGLDDLIGYVRACGNDLEVPALRLLPAIAEVKAALAAQPGCRLTAMSGSGPTCFALFTGHREATQAADALQRTQPGWWVVATALDWPGAGSGVR
jgi:4-diphosphocytidyl-2-C-methyl-D-erythritol kinase